MGLQNEDDVTSRCTVFEVWEIILLQQTYERPRSACLSQCAALIASKYENEEAIQSRNEFQRLTKQNKNVIFGGP